MDLKRTEKWEHLFRRLPGICGDVRIVTIHSKAEEAPDYEGDVRFVDIESGDGVEVTMTRRAVQDYLEKKSAHEAEMMAACSQIWYSAYSCRSYRRGHGNCNEKNAACRMDAIEGGG